MSLPPTTPGPPPPSGHEPGGKKPLYRQPFSQLPQPTPFHRTREFRFFSIVACALLGVMVIAVYVLTTRNPLTSPAPDPHAGGTPPRVVLTEEERAARELKLHTDFEGSLLDTANGDGFVETPGYHRLLEILKSYTAEDFEKLPRKQLDWGAAMADPGAWRGQIVWMRGVLAERYAVRLKHPVFGVEDVTQGILIEGDGSNGVFFDMIDEVPPLSFREDAIDAVGIFYRTVRYPTARRDLEVPVDKEKKRVLPPYRYETPEGDVQEAPYILVKTLTPVDRPKRDPTGILKNHKAAIFAALGLAFAAFWLITYSVQRRKRRLRGPVRARPADPSVPFGKRTSVPHGTAGPPTEV